MSCTTFFLGYFPINSKKETTFQKNTLRQIFRCEWKYTLTMAVFSFSCLYAFYFLAWDKYNFY